MSLYNVDNIIEVELYPRVKNGWYTVVEEDYYEKHWFWRFYKVKVSKGIYSYFGKEDEIPWNSIIENGTMYYKPYIIIKFSNGQSKQVFKDTLEQARKLYKEIESKINNKIKI